jgi:hypothetical protein
MTSAPSPAHRQWSLWASAWTVLSVPGVCWAALTWNPVAVVGVAAFVTVFVALVLLMVRHGEAQWDARSSRGVASLGWIVRIGMSASALVIATSAIVDTVPGVLVLWLLAVAVTAPPIIQRWRRILERDAPIPASPGAVRQMPRSAPQPCSANPADAVRTMSDAELCRAWRHTFWTLRETTTATDRLKIVEHRGLILDELESRHAEALRAWFESVDRACDSPRRFLTGGGDQPEAA